jgi:DNA modification methylase
MTDATILRADARRLPLANDSVDLVVSSPPYWSLRSYQDAGEHYSEQIGAEATPGEFVDVLLEVTRECMRVLKPAGSIWINLGDKYNAYNGNRGEGTIQRNKVRQVAAAGSGLDVRGVRPKSLIGIPWRYAIRCIDELGLILRAEVIWSKPNGLPESVTDRVRRSHEQWFHFTLNPRYYSAVDEIREATKPHPWGDARRALIRPAEDATSTLVNDDRDNMRLGVNQLGKLPGSVWEIATEPLKVPDHLGIDHFAAFPTEWPRRIIQGWSPAGVCTACGEGRRPVTDREQVDAPGGSRSTLGRAQADAVRTKHIRKMGRGATIATITGETCACLEPTAPTTPSVILDPFGGTGTSALVAKALGRQGVSVDMSQDYCRLAKWRVSDPAQIAKAMRVDKPVKQAEGQLSMLDLFTEDGGAA